VFWHIAFNISSGISTEGLFGAPRIVIGPILPPPFLCSRGQSLEALFDGIYAILM
jgi:hypothetical protein